MPWFIRPRLAGTLVIALAGVLLLSAFAFASEFSADMVTRHSEGEMTGRIYVKNNMLRSELDLEDETLVTIINLNEGVAWLLMPENMYMEISAPEDPSILESDEYEEVNLGVETVQGYVCDVIQFIYKENAFGTSKHWVARKLNHPLRMEEMDETGKVTAITEYSNIKEEALCHCLFELPEGCEKVDLFGIPGMLGTGGAQGFTGVPGSGAPADVPGGSGMPGTSGVPGSPGDLSGVPGVPGGIPGMPQGMPGMPQMPQDNGPGLPDVYEGTFSVIVSGEREWETLVGGIGEDRYTRHKKTVREKAVVYVPQIVLSTGTMPVTKSPVRATVSFDYRRYEDDVVIERWLCEERTVETEFSPCFVQHTKFDPFASGVYTVGYGGFEFLGPIGELSYYHSDGTMYHKEKAYYSGHGFSFTVPVPSGTDRLSGSKTIRLEGAADWITAEVSWDLKPVTGN